MQNIDIVKNIDIDNTYRVSRIMADFDVKTEHLKREYHLQIELPQEWQIGLICGGSGTGKTTLAKECFKDWYTEKVHYEAESVIDDMPKTATMDEIEKMFYAVGFGSVPCWLKPYAVLSDGEQMRVQLANSLLSSDNVIFDEFTSVVDRNVAKTLCTALNKSLKHYPNKRFVAVSCHKDIIEYLQPDWVFDTDTMSMSFHVAQAEQKYTIRKCGRGAWAKFRQYHYLNTEINISSQCYGLYNVDNEQVAFIAIMHFPHPINKRIKKIHRFVVLPDYQGIGIGGIFLDNIAKIYQNKGFDVRIVTSAKNLIHKLDKSKKWRLIHWGIKKGGNKTENKSLLKSHRKVKTATFKYIFK